MHLLRIDRANAVAKPRPPRRAADRPPRRCLVCMRQVPADEDHDCPYGTWVGE